MMKRNSYVTSIIQVCTRCKKEKSLNDFNKSKRKKSGRLSQCKDCSKSYHVEYYVKNKPKILARNQKWIEENRKRYVANQKESDHRRYLDNREEMLDRQNTNQDRRKKVRFGLLQRYGLTLEDYEHILELQGGMCAICKGPETRKSRLGRTYSLGVDHDHDTGIIRGLLCFNCNFALGKLSDSSEVLFRAAYYLLEAEERAKVS